MRRLFFISAMGLFLVSCQQDKIGYVDNVRVMADFNEKQNIEESFNQKSEVLAKRRDSISKALELEYMDLQNRARKMSQQKVQEEMGLFQQKGQIIGQQLQNEEQALQSRGQAQMDSLVKVVRKEIKKYGEANGYTYILSGGDGGAVLHGTDAQDLTDEILAILNASEE